MAWCITFIRIRSLFILAVGFQAEIAVRWSPVSDGRSLSGQLAVASLIAPSAVSSPTRRHDRDRRNCREGRENHLHTKYLRQTLPLEVSTGGDVRVSYN
ncbi:hypothetical protein B0T13DRAFT_456070 [Neurospora crassa]|nr:hypothetical protein B0T13DRAFT_456070 [Neurospora crassa]